MRRLWSTLSHHAREGRFIGPILLAWVVTESVAALLPVVVPDTAFLAWYLTDEAEAATAAFVAGDGILLPDPATGWRSAPLEDRGNWVTDADGARTTGRGGWDEAGTVRVLALGSSMMNGGEGVSNQETITAYLEEGPVRTKNFATMLYGLDQSLLAFESRLSELGAHIVLVALDPDPYAPLRNMYVPLRSPGEANMPFVKPRFVLSGNEIELVTVDPSELLTPGGHDRLVELFESYDDFSYRFAVHKHLSMTPLLSAVGTVATRSVSLRRRLGDSEADIALLQRLMERVDSAVRDSGAEPCFVAIPPRFGGSRLPLGPDLYGERIARWTAEGHCVIDGRSVFAASDEPRRSLYGPDGGHLSAAGNRVMAEAIRLRLSASLRPESTDRP